MKYFTLLIAGCVTANAFTVNEAATVTVDVPDFQDMTTLEDVATDVKKGNIFAQAGDWWKNHEFTTVHDTHKWVKSWRRPIKKSKASMIGNSDLHERV